MPQNFFNTRNVLASCLIVTSLFAPSSSYAQEAAKTNVLDRQDVETIVREYLLANPGIILEIQEAFEAKQQEQLAEQQIATLQESQDQIYNAPYQIEFGDPQSKITVVEFFDYNCGFCQRAMTDMQQLLEGNDDIRFVLKEFPVLGEGSLEASRVSMALSKILPEKHTQFHIQLLSLDGPKDGQRAMALAVELGADEQKLREEMEKPGIIEAIQGTYEIANALGVTGTPSYIVGNQVVFGAVGVDELKEKIDLQNQ